MNKHNQDLYDHIHDLRADLNRRERAIYSRTDRIQARIDKAVSELTERIAKATASRLAIRERIDSLFRKLRCAAKGHTIAYNGNQGLGNQMAFHCVECCLEYYRHNDSLTPHEKELVELTKKPPPYAVPCEGS